jgi:hypothetical protein
VESLTTVEFGSESTTVMAGTEAGVFYVAEGTEGVIELYLNNED